MLEQMTSYQHAIELHQIFFVMILIIPSQFCSRSWLHLSDDSLTGSKKFEQSKQAHYYASHSNKGPVLYRGKPANEKGRHGYGD